MRKTRFFPLALTILCTLGTADARPGQGMSMGSRGSHTWSAPPRTSMTPSWARPMDRTATPNTGFGAAQPRPAAPPMYGRPASRYGTSFPSRHPFMTGFMGGMLGAGLFGILSGHGMFGGMSGGTSFLGFLFQVLIIGSLIVFLIRAFSRRGNAGGPVGSGFARAGAGPVSLTTQDYKEFEMLLQNVQAAWSARDMRALSNMATPEMAGYFNEQLSDLASRGARNVVSGVQFMGGDLSEAWREGSFTYATVAMRYSMFDVTTDMMGQVIDGSTTERTTVTELWTFLKADGRGNWVLSAIQQGG
ncbi:Tim44 domain-containing protein [Gluconobacter wancherniae]|uniref:Tim44 domain-containing protein n=1 Tax=Gluconobacter wancherniae TaxID=1307955 RepID=UPI001B8B1497|nr:TIM44-like domain-containing protein [Gluconobacter wancherniae]MBS1093495.1 TIM44-like domain-containing protein [Gluconobacter wancherniae]